MPTNSIREVATKAGVSTATVSHVINETRFVAENTRQKVIHAMDELDYTPNFAAKTLRSQQTFTIGLVIPDISNHFFTSVVKGIEQNLYQKGYQLLVGNTDEKLELEIEKLKTFQAQQVSGIILASSAEHYQDIEPYLNLNTPIVFIDRIPDGTSGDYISVESEKAVYNAVQLLIERGHERIGMVTGIDTLSTTRERINGYRNALVHSRINVDENLIFEGDSKFTGGYHAAEKLLTQPGITAMFVANNLMTIGACTYFKEYQITIPEDIAIIGFDDYEWAKITDPPLSVIKQPVEKIGEKAAEALLHKIKTDDSGNQSIRLPTELILRESC
ncbi:LacI family DNA-binding transcriptional regulator [Salicibibacter cibi]|uniref:LacI family DNA-binding transcriptional regulator n=1 Tax=Salicibibacter cibi TaxID=2743001 RepID=A0A7T6ZDJ9_9BACI|nr:LacI family DNA-binding transcriptional regulator [Salicibibacter cibi]QQK81427.1 LacI family DNA-binding transcriptional regulator [Salicibibacter cibi]